MYSGHRAFVLATFVDSVIDHFGEVSIAMDEMGALFSAMDIVKTPLSDAWRLAGRHRLVYRFNGADMCPIVSSWFDALRSGELVDRQLALIRMFRCGLCRHFAEIGFHTHRVNPDLALMGTLRNLGI